MGPKVKTDSSMIFWAFRYCLGRRSYAVSDCVDNIIAVWGELEENTQNCIVKEINEAFKSGCYGDEMDRQQWEKVLGADNGR